MLGFSRPEQCSGLPFKDAYTFSIQNAYLLVLEKCDLRVASIPRISAEVIRKTGKLLEKERFGRFWFSGADCRPTRRCEKQSREAAYTLLGMPQGRPHGDADAVVFALLSLSCTPSACVCTCVHAACYGSASVQVCVSTITQLRFNAILTQESEPMVPAPTPAGHLPAVSQLWCGPLLHCPPETSPTRDPRCLPALPPPHPGSQQPPRHREAGSYPSLKGEDSEH